MMDYEGGDYSWLVLPMLVIGSLPRAVLHCRLGGDLNSGLAGQFQ